MKKSKMTKQILLMLILLCVTWPLLAFAAEVNLPKTGQKNCYDENGNQIDCTETGQDGDIRAGIEWPSPRFTDNGNGTVTDNLTGLIWLKNAGCAGAMTWNQALSFCNNLSSGSCELTDGSVAGDWRLPNIVELESLVNTGVADVKAWLNSLGFTNVQNWELWSATTSTIGKAWIIDLSDGGVFDRNKSNNDYWYNVWPVYSRQSTSSGDSTMLCETWKTGQTISYAAGDDGTFERGVSWPSPRFTDNGNGTVTDNLTGLIWLKNAGCTGAMTWNEALSFCNNLSSGSCELTDGSVAGDWRLPNRKELLSLIDYTQSVPPLPTGHPFDNVKNVSYPRYWSATTLASYTSEAWYVNMNYGYVNYGNKAESSDFVNYYGWPVRDGQSGSSGNLTISYPNGGEDLTKGTNYTITWDSTAVTGSVEIGLYKGGTEPSDMVLQLSAATDNDGQYTFNPSSSLEDGSDYYIGISAEEGDVTDFSDSAFSIASVPDPACVSQKLKTASTLCTALMNCWVKEIKDVTEKYEVKNYTGVSIQKFGTGWGKAQDKAENKGLGCDAGSQDEIGEMINDAMEDIYDEISSDTDKGNKDSITLGSDLLKAAGKRCSSLLNARSAYIKDKTSKKDAKLSAAIAKADNAFSASFIKAKAKAAKKGLSCDDSIRTYLEGAIDDLELGILSGMGIPLP